MEQLELFPEQRYVVKTTYLGNYANKVKHRYISQHEFIRDEPMGFLFKTSNRITTKEIDSYIFKKLRHIYREESNITYKFYREHDWIGY